MASENGRKNSRGRLGIMVSACFISSMEVMRTKGDMFSAYYDDMISPGYFSRGKDVIEFHRKKRKDYQERREFRELYVRNYRDLLKRSRRN